MLKGQEVWEADAERASISLRIELNSYINHLQQKQ